MAGLNGAFREKIVTFGDNEGLVGVLTSPAEQRNGAPHVVLLNSGIIHRVGPHRLHVGFARALAAEGISTFRFDLSGIGDSERQSAALSLQDSVMRDIASALDFLCAKHGAQAFVLVGLCSGAFDSFEYAVRDKRVIGACMLDMPGPFRNWSHLAYRIVRRASRPGTWGALFKQRAQAASRGGNLQLAPAPQDSVFLPGVRGYIPRERMEADLNALLARQVKLAFFFTGGVDDDYNHRLQFRIRFPRAAAHPSVKVEFVPWSDHTFSTRSARAHVIEFVRKWMLEYSVWIGPVVTFIADSYRSAG